MRRVNMIVIIMFAIAALTLGHNNPSLYIFSHSR
jgi:hypothetical protein